MIVQKVLSFPSKNKTELIDITNTVGKVVSESGLTAGSVSVYAQGATAAVMIQENWDDSVQRDVLSLLRKIIPAGVWEHDRQDNNGDSHLKAGLIGPSETIPVIGGEMGLSRWQNIFFCEFDGPRTERRVVVTFFGQ
jgi:secondary thiamine-phosphate synthase enzyme